MAHGNITWYKLSRNYLFIPVCVIVWSNGCTDCKCKCNFPDRAVITINDGSDMIYFIIDQCQMLLKRVIWYIQTHILPSTHPPTHAHTHPYTHTQWTCLSVDVLQMRTVVFLFPPVRMSPTLVMLFVFHFWCYVDFFQFIKFISL